MKLPFFEFSNGNAFPEREKKDPPDIDFYP